MQSLSKGGAGASGVVSGSRERRRASAHVFMRIVCGTMALVFVYGWHRISGGSVQVGRRRCGNQIILYPPTRVLF